MRALGASRTSVVAGGVLAGNWARDPLWKNARAVPSLDLRFAENKSLTDANTGASLVTFTRASTGTYVGSNGVLQSAVTNEARFDHNPTTGESLGLLVEEARTNSLTYSEDTSQWLAPTNVTLSQNQTTAPDGASTADQYLETAATGLHVQDGMPFTFVTSTVYTYSVFVKSIGGRNFEIGYPPTIFTNRFARFNLSGSGSVQGSDAGVTASIQAYANGWYRCSATNTCASGGSSRIGTFIINDSFSRSYAGDVTKGLFIWGAQLEAGAFPTSYIPTTTATVTRAADVASITGTAFSSWYNQSAGTLVGEYRTPASGTRGVADFNDNTANERIGMLTNSTDPKMLAVDGGTTQVDLDGGTIVANTLAKTAIAYATNDFSIVNAGGAAVTDTSGTLPTVDRLMIGTDQTGNYQNGQIKRLTFWPVRLPNPTLQAITQP
jgi:hypothetical protein